MSDQNEDLDDELGPMPPAPPPLRRGYAVYGTERPRLTANELEDLRIANENAVREIAASRARNQDNIRDNIEDANRGGRRTRRMKRSRRNRRNRRSMRKSSRRHRRSMRRSSRRH